MLSHKVKSSNKKDLNKAAIGNTGEPVKYPTEKLTPQIKAVADIKSKDRIR